MRFPVSLSSIWPLICAAAIPAPAGFGQSLSIAKVGATNYSVQASAPANNPHTLQASADLQLWVDLRSDVQGSTTVTLDDATVSNRYFRLIPSPPPPPPIRILLLGDSMASDCCGWGGGVYGYFKPEATVVNYAMPWVSTKVFLQSAEWDKMLLIQPDYVFMQYGFMDGGLDFDRNTTLEEFEANLRTIIDAVQSFNGVPVLITVHAARLWDENGKVVPAWEERNDITRRLAAELDLPLVDFYKITEALFNELGPEGTAFMHWAGGTPDDFMHFSPLGAQYVSRLLVNALPASFSPYLTGMVFEPPPVP